MPSVTLGRTGITVDKNAFGALPIQRVSFEEADAILKKAFEGGIFFYDTARNYSDSEEKLGRSLSSVRNRICIATKTSKTTVEGFWADLRISLDKLKTDHVDIYQFHNPSFVPKPGDGTGLYEAMLEARRQGLIRFIGISNHRLPLAEDAVRSGLYDTLQFPFSYLADPKEQALVRLCRDSGVGFIAMKALSGGLIKSARAASAFMSRFDNVLPIWGIQRMEELEEFLSFIYNPPSMTPELQALIDTDRQELFGSFCRGCGYCLPCPAGIEIPTCARMSLLLRRAPAQGFLSPEWQVKMAKIDDCIECMHCSSHCPYGLDTPALLKANYADYKTFLR